MVPSPAATATKKAGSVAAEPADITTSGGPSSVEAAQHLADGAEDLVDVALVDDQRRRQRDDVAGGADQQALVVTAQEGLEGPLGRPPGKRLQLDGGDQAETAQID